MRKRFLTALLCCAVVAAVVAAQKKPDHTIKLSCGAHPVHAVRPTYPESAKQKHVQGKVSLTCTIARDGSVKRVRATTGNALLIKAATDAVLQWKFKPVLLNGEAVEIETTVIVDFQLSKDQKNPDTNPLA